MADLIAAIKSYNAELALSLIPTSDIGYIDPDDGNTALMWACDMKMIDIAMALIASGLSKPQQVNKYNMTALLYACHRNLSDIAMTLIATGQSNPGQVNNYGQTALIQSCIRDMPDVALALIATGQSKPEQISARLNTALLWACYKLQPSVALALLATGHSKPECYDEYGKSAYTYAMNNTTKMSKVITILENYDDYIAKLYNSTNQYDDPNYVMTIEI